MRFKPYLIKRAIRFWWQRRIRGWDDSETWALHWTLSKMIAPRLRRFKEVNIGVPATLSPEKWDEIIEDMIYAFEFCGSEAFWECNEFDARTKRGLKLFHKHFFSLWW